MDAGDATRAIRSCFPELGDHELRPLRSGRSHSTFAYGDSVFRFPGTAADTVLLRRELRLLAALAPALPLPISTPTRVAQWRGRPFAGAPYLAGKPIATDDLFGPQGGEIACELGEFLWALHRFPLEQAAVALQTPPDAAPADPREWLDRLRMRVFPRLSPSLRIAVDGGVTRFAKLGIVRPRALTHHDLGRRHLLVHEGHLAGVIDFSAAALADPAVDFSGILAWAGWNGVDDVARFYDGPLGLEFEERVEFAYWTLPLGWLAFAVDRENEPLVGRARSELSMRMQRAGVMPAG